MSLFAQVKLSSVATINSGYAFKSEDLTNNSVEVPVLKIANVTSPVATLVFDDHFPREKITDRIAKYLVLERDVLVAMTGMGSVGRIGVVRGVRESVLLNQRVGVVRGKRSLYDQLFLGCVLTAKHYENTLYDLGVGAGQPNVSPKDIANLLVPLPTISEQKRIAAILTAYDELIENNQRRIALLEKMAEEIYREWFVRMRFPDHEKVKKVKGVPEGWQITELKDVAIEASRSTRPGSHLAERLYLPLELFNTRKMIPGGHQSYTEAQSSLVTFEKGDILFGAMRPYQHKIAMAPFAGITRTTCFVIRPKMPQAWSWLFLALFQQTSVDYATMICNGADRPYVVWNKGMERMKLLRPDDALLAKFEEVARPILDSILSMYFVQLKLKECRDMLLPRLISGKLSVENLDIQFPPSMEETAHEI